MIKPKHKDLLQRLLALGILAGLTIIVYIYHPATPYKMMRCPFREITGLYCPGCGSVRAMTQLVQGNLLRAIRHNVFAVAFSPLLAWFILSNLKLVITGSGLPFPSLPSRAIWGLLILLLLFAVLRNLPIARLNFLRP